MDVLPFAFPRTTPPPLVYPKKSFRALPALIIPSPAIVPRAPPAIVSRAPPAIAPPPTLVPPPALLQTLAHLQSTYLRRRNTAASINRLPQELLTLILSFAQHDSIHNHHSSSGSSGGPDPSARLTELSRVCAHWRATALAHPHLWAHISLREQPGALGYDLHFAALCLVRSGAAPLKLMLAGTRRAFLVSMLLAPHAHRISELALELDPNEDSTNMLAFPVPNIHTLHIRARTDTRSGARSESPALSLPRALTGRCSPVRKLHLAGFGPDGLDARFTGLTHLSLTAQTATPRHLQGLFALLNANARTLQEFVFEDARTGGVGELAKTDMLPSEPVRLPCAKLACVHATVQRASCILAQLELPSTCIVRVHVHADHSYLPTSVRVSPLACVDRINITARGNEMRFVALGANAGVAVSYEGLVSTDKNAQWAREALAAFADALPQEHVRQAWIAVEPRGLLRDEDVFAKFGALEMVIISGGQESDTRSGASRAHGGERISGVGLGKQRGDLPLIGGVDKNVWSCAGSVEPEEMVKRPFGLDAKPL